MKKLAVLMLSLALSACGGGEQSGDFALDKISREPVSVRGWVDDVAGAKKGATPEMEMARRQEMFAQTSVWVEGISYITGGMAENGSFIMLDVPPGNVTMGLSAPGVETTLTLQNIPANADVLIPGIVLSPQGAVIPDPTQIRVRVPGEVSKLTPTGKTAMVGPHKVPIYSAPLNELTDRRDYPQPGGIPAPVAVYR